MSYRRAASQFAAARRILMLPHPDGEAESVSRALHEVDTALENLDRSRLDEHAEKWLSELAVLMDYSDVVDEEGKGRAYAKVRTFNIDNLSHLSQLVDDLQSWFDRQNG